MFAARQRGWPCVAAPHSLLQATRIIYQKCSAARQRKFHIFSALLKEKAVRKLLWVWRRGWALIFSLSLYANLGFSLKCGVLGWYPNSLVDLGSKCERKSTNGVHVYQMKHSLWCINSHHTVTQGAEGDVSARRELRSKNDQNLNFPERNLLKQKDNIFAFARQKTPTKRKKKLGASRRPALKYKKFKPHKIFDFRVATARG